MDNAIPAKIIFRPQYQPITYMRIATFYTDLETILMLLAKKGQFKITRMLIEVLANVNLLQKISGDKNKFIHLTQEKINPSSIILQNSRQGNEITLDIVTQLRDDTDHCSTSIVDTQEKKTIKRILKRKIQKDLDRTHNKNIILDISLGYNFNYIHLLPNSFNYYKAITIRDENNGIIGMTEYRYNNPQIIFFTNVNKIKEKSLQPESIRNMLLELLM